MNLPHQFIFFAALLALALPSLGGEADGTLVKVGDAAPAFTVTTTDGAQISTQDHAGRVLLVSFFATWCVPCMQELPHLESDVWKKFKDRGLILVAIGREHRTEEMKQFKADRQFTMPIAADPDRAIFAKFAKDFIPRAILIGADGKVAFESMGYDADEFPRLIEAVEAALAKAAKADARR